MRIESSASQRLALCASLFEYKRVQLLRIRPHFGCVRVSKRKYSEALARTRAVRGSVRARLYFNLDEWRTLECKDAKGG